MTSQARRPATRRMGATGLVNAEQLPKFLARRDLFLREFAGPEKISLEFLAKLRVLPLFLNVGFAAAPGWWLVIFTSHGSAPVVHKKRCAGQFRTPLSGQGVESGVVGLVPFCVSFVVGVVPWMVVFVPFVLVVLESMVVDPLTELESLPEDPMSSELVLHPATKPAKASAAKNCFIISLCLCFQPLRAQCPAGDVQFKWGRFLRYEGGEPHVDQSVIGALAQHALPPGQLKAFDSAWPSVMFCPPVVWRS